MKCILFDVDGTLLYSTHAAINAFYSTVSELCSVDASLDSHPVSFHGRTDRSILEDLITSVKGDVSEELLQQAFEEVPQNIEVENKKLVDSQRIRVCDGVLEALSALRRNQNDFCVALLTGNTEIAARKKFEIAGLDFDQFTFGAFGSVTRERNELPQIARTRFQEIFGYELQPEDFIIIGDTPKDVECAKVNGLKCVAVATGAYTVEELEKSNPDAVLRNLSDIDDIVLFLNEL